MSAYVIADVEIHDPEAYGEYRAQVLPTVEAHGGRFLVRGGAWSPLEGEWSWGRVVVLEFPDAEAARRWHDSPEYRPLRELRQSASEGRMIVVEGVAG